MTQTLLLASPVSGTVRKAGAIIFKVKDFDPTRHPRGYKGMFIETPDKREAGRTKVGDVIATKSGKVFRVEGHGPKGIKVATVDPDTGEVQNKGTIVANGIEIAVFESGKGIGTRHAISDLTPGSYVQVPKSGKRFKISKHGAPSTSKTGKVSRNTTVFPVDANGDVSGKHTILPSHTEVVVTGQKAGGPVTPAVVAQVAAAPAVPSPPATGLSRMERKRAEWWLEQADTQGKVSATDPDDVKALGHLASLGFVRDNGNGTWNVTPSGVAYVQQHGTELRPGGSAKSMPIGSPTPPAVPAPPVASPAVPTPPAVPAPRATGRVKPHNPLGLVVGDTVKEVGGTDTFEVSRLDADGVPYAKDDLGIEFAVTDRNKWAKHVPEVLPSNLSRPPRSYDPGTGRKSAVVIRETVTHHMLWQGLTKESSYELVRVPDGADPTSQGDSLGSYSKIGEARKDARSRSASHEAVLEQRLPSIADKKNDAKPGDWVQYRGAYHEIATIESPPPWAGSDAIAVTFTDGRYGTKRTLSDRDTVYIGDPSGLDAAAQAANPARPNGAEWLRAHQASGTVDTALNQAVVAQRGALVVRGARENLYLPQLSNDWTPDDLLGQTKGDALAALRKIGYGEITPREPNMTKMVNAFGKRLHLHNKDGKITLVDEIQSQATRGGGTGFHGQLQAVLDSGGDVRSLDPRLDPNREAHNTHTRQILFDMALGKQQGVEKQFGGNAKVKTDAAYEKELRADPAFKQTLTDAAAKADDPGVNVPVRTDVMSGKWGVSTGHQQVHFADMAGEHHATAAIAAGERNGVADIAKQLAGDPNATFEQGAKALGDAWAEVEGGKGIAAFTDRGLSKGTADYLANSLADIKPRGKRQWDARQTEYERRQHLQESQALSEEVTKRRKIEGTVPSRGGGTFELPLWDEVDLQKQDIREIETLIQNAQSVDVVPVFFTGGVLTDGVAYGRRAKSGEIEFQARVPKDFDSEALRRIGGQRETNSRWPTRAVTGGYSSTSSTSAGHMYKIDEGGGKYIEYVPHADGQTAPTNQRGRVTLVGYSPDEATAKLKSLGLVHDLEEEVPFKSVLRSERRHGKVSPLHGDYVSGDAPLPTIPAPIVHGMNKANAEIVLNSGGLMPIADRFIAEIPLSGTIPANDIRAGVDNMVFAGVSPNFAQYGVGMSVVYKDSAYLRRDVLVTDRAFGNGDTRYPSYRKYANAQRKAAGEKNTDDSIYVPLSPAARQAHINGRVAATNGSLTGLGPSQNEWNVTGVPIEDMAYIFMDTQADKDRIDRQLDRMLREGRISAKPEVRVGAGYGQLPGDVSKRDWNAGVDPRKVPSKNR